MGGRSSSFFYSIYKSYIQDKLDKTLQQLRYVYRLRAFKELRLKTFPPAQNFGWDQLFMPSVRIKENEPFDVALRRFKRSCEKAGVLAKVRSCEFYEKPTWVRKRKAAAAVKRNQKKVSRESRKFTRLY